MVQAQSNTQISLDFTVTIIPKYHLTAINLPDVTNLICINL